MKRLFLCIFLFCFVFESIQAQRTLSGQVKNESSGQPISGVVVEIAQLQTTTTSDDAGMFIFEKIKPGIYEVSFTVYGFDSYSQNFDLYNDDIFDATINLNPSTIISELTDATVILHEVDVDDDSEGYSDVSSILHASKDVFSSTAAYTFGPMRFKIRGYDNKYADYFVDGILMNNPENGRGTFYLWGGLNDVTRNQSVYNNIQPTEYGFGNIAGSQNITLRASKQRKGVKIGYASTNTTYRNRIMATYSSGLMKNGWAVTVSGSKRWAEEGYVEGTFYDAYGYFIGIEKQFNDHHSIALSVFGSPSKRGGQTASTQEAFDLLDNNYYNPLWGWQDGKKRNSRTTDTHIPVGFLNHFWTINKKTSLNTTAMFSKGYSKTNALDWYNANDPRPDYYRNLPSYDSQDPVLAAAKAEAFINGGSQINWDKLYEANWNSFTVIDSADGDPNKKVAGLKSEYVIESRVREEQQYAVGTVLIHELTDHIYLTFGVQHRSYTGKQFKTLEDLLGGEFIIDNDKYAERDFFGPIAANDIRYPNRIIRQGDKFGYEYDANVQITKAWFQSKFSYSRIDFYLAGQYSYTELWRKGYMQNGVFANNSLGKSDVLSFPDYAAKGGLVFKINGRNYLIANAAYITKSPTFQDAFLSPRTRNQYVKDLKSEQIATIDAGYVLRTPTVKASLNVFYTTFKDQTWTRSFYYDNYHSFISFSMKGIDKIHQGIEAAIEANITKTLSVNAVGSFCYNRWNSRPIANAAVDNSQVQLLTNDTVYAIGFIESGSPQTAMSFGIKYSSPKYWFFGINANYLADNYISFSPIRRTQDPVADIDHNSELFETIVNQEKLPEMITLNAYIGKSFKISHKYYLSINLSVNNVLGDTELKTGGYEQLRLDISDLDKFPPKYFYYYGRTYFLNIGFRF